MDTSVDDPPARYPHPEEPLEASAAIGWTEAPRCCYRDPGSGETCERYHRIWQYLRLLGVITSVRTNTEFLMDQFRQAARQPGFRRVLVSATADYSMLAHVHAAYRGEGASLDATVVDRCPTSLILNRWYADRMGIALSTVCEDVLTYENLEAFDLVCTHNFLNRFTPQGRTQVIARWHASLRPGGLVVTTQRVHPNGKEGSHSRFTAAQAEALAARVSLAARERTQPLEVDPDELARITYEYALSKMNSVIRSTQDLTRPFEAGGFEIEQIDEGGGPAERERDRPSSPAGKDTYRMRLVARRR
jgi:SAM-dependent methyltransferase